MHRVRLKVRDIVAYRYAGGSFRYGMCLTKNTLHTHTYANDVRTRFPEEVKFHAGI